MDSYLLEINQIITDNYEKFQNKDIENIKNLTLIKNLPYEQKLQAIKLVLATTTIVDSVSIFNLHLFVMGLQIIDQKEIQGNENIWANDIKEFSDLVVDLRDEIETMCHHLIYCFLGVLKTFRTHINEGLKTEMLEPRDSLLLESLSFLGIGNVLKKIKTPINVDEIPYYLGGESTIHTMCNHFNVLNLLSTKLTIE